MTTTHTPTPISARMAAVAEGQGWLDVSYYGDTDYGLAQAFTKTTSKDLVTLKWAADGRHGVGDVLERVEVRDGTDQLVHLITRGDQAELRAAAVQVLTTFGE